MTREYHRQPAVVLDCYDEPVAQGDLLFIRRKRARAELGTAVKAESGEHIIAHSETGHHHVVDASDVIMYQGADPLRAYLVPADGMDQVLIHHTKTSPGFHPTVGILCGDSDSVVEVRRQREMTPEGWVRAAD